MFVLLSIIFNVIIIIHKEWRLQRSRGDTPKNSDDTTMVRLFVACIRKSYFCFNFTLFGELLGVKMVCRATQNRWHQLNIDANGNTCQLLTAAELHSKVWLMLLKQFRVCHTGSRQLEAVWRAQLELTIWLVKVSLN